MKVLVLLLLSLQGYAEDCGQDKGFRIIISDDIYQLQLCNYTDNCTKPFNLPSLNETRLCNYRSGISETTGDDCLPQNCVTRINSFFSKNCQIFEHSAATCLPSTSQPITPTACTSEVLLTPKPANDPALAAALGALTGLYLVTLALVVTGWVWTCWTMKKKKKETQLCKNCQKQEPEEEQFCPNQIHTKTTTQPVVGTAIELLLNSLEDNEQSNNGLSSKDNKGHCDVNRVENFYTSSEGSTNSSLQEQVVNRVEQEESGEKHVYNVLEKPGGDDYEDPDKDLEENTAMEYETPLPLKEL